ncbi:MAG TPA: formate dehydrogenase accessory sulfurtransferase FdhD [Longimicrobiaceae bacterium]|jgi:FdhD protein|nr:formate dehydrogenase accessory sulfurtransferase FdhD [Longimicrobiaceae bacterium]
MTARPGSTVRRAVDQVSFDGGEAVRRTRTDVLATEEPLEIRIVRADDARGRRVLSDRAHRVSVTMRTPGADFELAAGFLYAEGLIGGGADIGTISYCVDAEQRYNVVNVVLAPGVAFDPAQLARNFFATSSCGVCGKASIEAVTGAPCPRIVSDVSVTPETLLSLPGKLRPSQAVFERTGGLHAAALFDADGNLLRVREDVGRHNAMDKLVGGALLAGEVPLADRVVLVSGRLSFELVQKAARAGVAVLAGVSAPSSLAVELAEQAGMTLVGFLREARFNVYAGAERIAAPASVQNGR